MATTTAASTAPQPTADDGKVVSVRYLEHMLIGNMLGHQASTMEKLAGEMRTCAGRLWADRNDAVAVYLRDTLAPKLEADARDLRARQDEHDKNRPPERDDPWPESRRLADDWIAQTPAIPGGTHRFRSTVTATAPDGRVVGQVSSDRVQCPLCQAWTEIEDGDLRGVRCVNCGEALDG